MDPSNFDVYNLDLSNEDEDVTTQHCWRLAEKAPVPGKSEVHLWLIDLDPPETIIDACCSCLSCYERARAENFHFPQHRNRFIVAHGALRCILAAYANIPPRYVGFDVGKYGKPALAYPSVNGLTFNLSHSGDIALLGVAAGLQVGVDVERIRSDVAAIELAERFFATREAEKLRSLPSTQRKSAFSRCWTRKEAYVKAIGQGLSYSLASFEVAFAQGETARLVWADGGEIEGWRVYDAAPRAGYEAAVVVAGESHRLTYWKWKRSSSHLNA